MSVYIFRFVSSVFVVICLNAAACCHFQNHGQLPHKTWFGPVFFPRGGFSNVILNKMFPWLMSGCKPWTDLIITRTNDLSLSNNNNLSRSLIPLLFLFLISLCLSFWVSGQSYFWTIYFKLKPNLFQVNYFQLGSNRMHNSLLLIVDGDISRFVFLYCVSGVLIEQQTPCLTTFYLTLPVANSH